MKKLYISIVAMLAALSATAQISFDPEIAPSWAADTVAFPASPLKYQVIFIGGYDTVQTTATYGNPAGKQLAKQWHDFIGFTPDNSGSGDLGWVSVNHEMILADDKIGDGGGMTVFKVKRDPSTDTLIVVPQTLQDGRSGKFFNVDFVNTVGSTGMNCGGITSPVDGRIWTSEEWFRSSNTSIIDRDTSNFIIGQGTVNGTAAPAGFPGFNGQQIKKFENYNWNVEIDPRQAKAIRKQYNWGRQGFEGGTLLPDNKTVYLGEDDTPGFFTKFVANTPGDFTSGKTYVYKHDAPGKWVEIDNTVLSNMLNFSAKAIEAGATMFNRIEWVAYNPADGNVYLAETGRDKPGSAWAGAFAQGAVFAPHHIARGNQFGAGPQTADYIDYYGRVLKYDVTTQETSVFLEAGPLLGSSPSVSDYPAIHLSNPDGLGFMTVKKGTPQERTYMIIQEDLNGTSQGRTPAGVATTCEVYLLDMAIANPTLNDLVRIVATPRGAEVTGAIATPDGKSLLINSQHPSTSIAFPYNNSLTFVITGWDQVATSLERDLDGQTGFKMYPNPVSRFLQFEKPMDVALYDATGKRVLVARNTTVVDVQDLAPGAYVVMNGEGQSKTLIIE
jgi:hypothetical protein